MKPDRPLLVSLDRFYNVQEMQIIRKWMRDLRDAEMTRAIKTAENSDITKGRAQMIMELVELFDNAPQELKRLENRNGSQKPSTTGGAYRSP